MRPSPMSNELPEIYNANRLSDRILFALDLAIEQEDVNLAEMLSKALELSLTRRTGGAEFSERRDFSDIVNTTLVKLEELKTKKEYGEE